MKPVAPVRAMREAIEHNFCSELTRQPPCGIGFQLRNALAGRSSGLAAEIRNGVAQHAIDALALFPPQPLLERRQPGMHRVERRPDRLWRDASRYGAAPRRCLPGVEDV